MTDLPSRRALLWAVTLVLGYLGYLQNSTIIQNSIMELPMDGATQNDQTGRFALVPDLLHERLGFSQQEATAFSASCQREYLNRWEMDALPFI